MARLKETYLNEIVDSGECNRWLCNRNVSECHLCILGSSLLCPVLRSGSDSDDCDRIDCHHRWCNPGYDESVRFL